MTRYKQPAELPEPTELRILPTPKPCSKCKLPCIWGTPRGRAIHPTCEGRENWLAPPVYRRTVVMVAVVLPGRIGPEPPPVHQETYGRSRPFVPAAAPYPCAACGEAAEVIRWMPQDVWRCPKHNPLNFPVQPWEGRGFPTPTASRRIPSQEEQ